MIKLLRNLATGALAGVVGTAAMDLLLYERYRRHGETSEAPPCGSRTEALRRNTTELAARAVQRQQAPSRAGTHERYSSCALGRTHREPRRWPHGWSTPASYPTDHHARGRTPRVRPAFGARLPSDGQVARCTLMS